MPLSRFILALLALGTLAEALDGCGANVAAPLAKSLPGGVSAAAFDAGTQGGLGASEAARPSVELGAPTAFALSPESAPFLAALGRVVEPRRRTLAASLLADATVASGLAGWARSGTDARLAVLKRAAAIEGQVMGFQAPPLVEQASDPSQPDLMAFYQPGSKDIGSVVLYRTAVTKGEPYLALSTVIHEMRHAAQYQLIVANRAGKLGADDKTLAAGYAAAWQEMDAAGGEAGLSYGDYAHLNVELDAFQTGNEVAALVSKGLFDARGYGFVDAQYGADGAPALDLGALSARLSGRELVAAVNAAESQAAKARGNSDGASDPIGDAGSGFRRHRDRSFGHGNPFPG